MKNIQPIIAFAIVIIFACFFINRCCLSDDPTTECGITLRIDTVTVYDTVPVRICQPADVATLGVRIVTLPAWRPPISAGDTSAVVEKPDSVAVEIPIERRHYAGEYYDAWVSGYQPSLDSLNIYRPVTTVTQTQTVTRWRTRRWGLSAGAGVALTPHGIEPGVFVGVSYTFFCF